MILYVFHTLLTIGMQAITYDAQSQPFFGHLVQHLNLIETEKIPTAGVDERNNLYYNPDFINDLTDEEGKGVMAHEVMHLALECFDRLGERDKNRWNIAQDIIINHILVQNGLDAGYNI